MTDDRRIAAAPATRDPRDQDACDTGDSCITCSDAAFPMRIESIAGDLGVCIDVNGLRTDVMLALVPGVQVGASVLVHAGVALMLDDATPAGERGMEQRA